jgi:hypothetical protein
MDGSQTGIARTTPSFDYLKRGFVVKIDELITKIEVEEESTARRRDKCNTEIAMILNLADQEGRANLTADEQSRCDELNATSKRCKDDLVGIRSKLERARQAKVEELEIAADSEERSPTNAGSTKPAYDRVARVGQEERTYTKKSDRDGGMFLRDVASSFLQQNPESNMRLNRHMQEERVERAEYLNRAAGTGAFTGLVVPQYLTDMYAPAVANMSPFADICNKHPLPADGMTVNISRITTATSAAEQTTENTAVSETDIDDTLLTENVLTAAGQQTLSRQAIERGTGVEDVTLGDLFRRYATEKDRLLINKTTVGLAALATANAYTDASPTAAELYPKLAAAAAGVEGSLLGFGQPTHVVMHSRRWHWLQSQLTTAWPAFTQPGVPTQAMGTNNAAAYASGVRGILPNGMSAVVDNNIPINSGVGTNEDTVFVVCADECHLWEDANAPVFIRAEQAKAASLGVLMVVYGYFAFSFRRFSGAVQSIAGTGLVTPVF